MELEGQTPLPAEHTDCRQPQQWRPHDFPHSPRKCIFFVPFSANLSLIKTAKLSSTSEAQVFGLLALGLLSRAYLPAPVFQLPHPTQASARTLLLSHMGIACFSTPFSIFNFVSVSHWCLRALFPPYAVPVLSAARPWPSLCSVLL